MISINTTILSYNKVKEIEEYKPILPPESIYPEESNNRSFQNFIPDKYDLDRIEFNNLNCERSSTPLAKNQINLKSLFYNSEFLSPIEKKHKYIESLPMNIYNNEKEKSIDLNNNKEIKYVKDKIQNKNIYRSQKDKIEIDISNNLNIQKEKLANKNNKNLNLNPNYEKEEDIVIQKKDISTPNLNFDILNSKKTSLNSINNLKKVEKKRIMDRNSINSALTTYNFKSMMRKDPNKENIIIINTSLYKRNKHKKGNNLSCIQTDIINKNSFNSFLKFEESSKEQRFSNIKSNLILNNNQKSKKQEILKHFMNSNSNASINNSKNENNKLDHSNLNSFDSIKNDSKLEKNDTNTSQSNSNLKIEETEHDANCEIKNTIKCSNLNNYTFRTGVSNLEEIINQNKLNNAEINKINFFNNDKKMKKINIKFTCSPLNNNNENEKVLTKKPSTSSIFSNKKYNFDFPKIIEEKGYGKDEIINSKNEEEKIIIKEKIKVIKEYISPLVNIKFYNLKKILKKDGFFNVLTFLDCYDLMNLLQTNKSFIFLINKAISNAYYHIIKKYLKKYQNDFELLKSSLIYSKVKNALKIDFVINIRFIKNILNNDMGGDKKNEFFNVESEKEIGPKCFQLIYFYKYFKSINPKKKLLTKENTKIVSMYDYYTYDLYSENDDTPDIYINKEQLIFNSNNISGEDKLVFIQPILPFKVNDKGIINLEIYSGNNYFINPSSIKIILKSFELKNYLEKLKTKGYNNLRICEYENTCFHWKYIIDERIKNINFREVINKVKKSFEPYFRITNISYESIGYFIFKINLVAVLPGEIDNKKIKNDFGINLIIRKKSEIVENEIKKNNLLLERREIYELRVGDTITLYFSTKIVKKNNKK